MPDVTGTAPAPGPRPRILIVEDYPYARDGLARFFHDHGWDSVVVADALEAIAHITSSAQNPFDVILVDLKLPGQNGVTIVQLIKFNGFRSPTTGRPVRVVAFTGLDDADALVRAAVDAGADAVAYKPPDWDRLVDIVEGRDAGDVPIPPRPPGPAPRPR